MTNYEKAVAFYTLVRRELVRMLRIASQVFLPPIITSTLYFLIFGQLIGARIGNINGFDYASFIAPGLILMSVITNAYANVSSSFFSTRFQKNVEEILVSPMSYGMLLGGFILGGVLRALIVGFLVFLISCFFVTYHIHHWPTAIIVLFLVAILFSLAGFMNAMLANNFDDVMIIPTFVLTPLTYLGGVFFSTSMLAPFWEKLSYFNPILYMVNAFRYGMLGYSSVNLFATWCIIVGLVVLFWFSCLRMMHKGIGLRD
ncbi:MAG: ABC transporter permease [Legionellaceae bacterium]|nr:ABC transporter permease [Legionellaceae bacterium]